MSVASVWNAASNREFRASFPPPLQNTGFKPPEVNLGNDCAGQNTRFSFLDLLKIPQSWATIWNGIHVINWIECFRSHPEWTCTLHELELERLNKRKREQDDTWYKLLSGKEWTHAGDIFALGVVVLGNLRLFLTAQIIKHGHEKATIKTGAQFKMAK